MDSNNRKVIILAVVAVVILIAVFIFTLNQLLGPDKSSSEDVVTSLPESDTRNDIPPIINDGVVQQPATSTSESVDNQATDTVVEPQPLITESDWRESVVSYGGQAQTNQSASTAEAPVTSGSPYSVDDLVANGLVLDYDYSWAYPTSYDMGGGRTLTPEDLANPTAFAAAVNPIPSLVNSFAKVKSCGSLKVPASEGEQARFLNELETYQPVICMGEAVADNCEFAWAQVTNPDGIAMSVYLAEREDGTCGVGTSYLPTHVSLCNFTDVMNAKTGDSLSYFEWLEVFMDEPGESFAKIFSSGTGEISGADCVLSQVK